VLVGVTPVYMAIKYQSPCELLSEPSILPSGSQAQLFEWWNTTYHASFMRPVKKWCRPSKFSPEVINRKRIAVAAIVGLAAIAIGGATSVGLSAVALTKVSTLADRVDDINNQQLVMMEIIKQVTANDKVEKLALKRLQHEIT
jgi:hypothetical protein